jgi:hypothetical protein
MFKGYFQAVPLPYNTVPLPVQHKYMSLKLVTLEHQLKICRAKIQITICNIRDTGNIFFRMYRYWRTLFLNTVNPPYSRNSLPWTGPSDAWRRHDGAAWSDAWPHSCTGGRCTAPPRALPRDATWDCLRGPSRRRSRGRGTASHHVCQLRGGELSSDAWMNWFQIIQTAEHLIWFNLNFFFENQYLRFRTFI